MKNDTTDTLLLLGSILLAIASAVLGNARTSRAIDKSVDKRLQITKKED